MSGTSPIPAWMDQLQALGNLTPAERAILDAHASGYNGTVTRGGFEFFPRIAWGQGESGETQILGYYGKPPGYEIAGSHEWFGSYDTQGRWTGPQHGAVAGVGSEFLIALAMVLGPFAAAIAGPGVGAVGATGTVAGDAFMPGVLGAGGSELAVGAVLPGLESYVVGTAAGAGGAAAGASASPGAGASLAGLAGTATKILGAISTVLGIAQQAADRDGDTTAPIVRPTLAPILPGVDNSTLIWGVVGVAALFLFSDKG